MLSYNCKEGDNPEGLPVVILILVSGQLSGEVEVKCEHVTFVVVIIIICNVGSLVSGFLHRIFLSMSDKIVGPFVDVIEKNGGHVSIVKFKKLSW